MSKDQKIRRLSDRELERVARHFKVLGEPMRLRILQAVCRAPCAVSEIVAAVGATQANVSKHLSLLAAAGILSRKREGQRIYYGLTDPLTIELCQLVHAHARRKSDRD
jgi:DNA-binding transcriptional ArsR family regulator